MKYMYIGQIYKCGENRLRLISSSQRTTFDNMNITEQLYINVSSITLIFIPKSSSTPLPLCASLTLFSLNSYIRNIENLLK